MKCNMPVCVLYSELGSERDGLMGHRRRLGLLLKRNSLIGKTIENLKGEVSEVQDRPLSSFHNLVGPFQDSVEL